MKDVYLKDESCVYPLRYVCFGNTSVGIEPVDYKALFEAGHIQNGVLYDEFVDMSYAEVMQFSVNVIYVSELIAKAALDSMAGNLAAIKSFETQARNMIVDRLNQNDLVTPFSGVLVDPAFLIRGKEMFLQEYNKYDDFFSFVDCDGVDSEKIHISEMTISDVVLVYEALQLKFPNAGL